MATPLMSSEELVLELSRLVGHEVELVQRDVGGPAYLVFPVDRQLGATAFWQQVRSAAMTTDLWRTP